jgi:SHS2 domain-containing protein
VENPVRGFREVDHTADVRLEVWGPDMAALLEEAARGMYRLMGVGVARTSRRHRLLEIAAGDREQLLVAFLEELLFIAEAETLAFDTFTFETDGTRLRAHMEGGPVAARSKEIKAVTFHRLEIRDTPHGVETTVTFDV